MVLFFSYLNEVEPVKVVNKIGLKHIVIADKDLHVAEWSCLMLTTTQQGDNDKGKFNKKSILKFSFENVIIVLCDKSRHVNNLFVKYKTNDKSTQINLHTCKVVLYSCST